MKAAFLVEGGGQAADILSKPKAEGVIWRALKAAGLVRR